MKTIVNNWHNISIGLAIIFAAFAFRIQVMLINSTF